MNSRSTRRRFPAEWEPQSATLLAWPYDHSDWEPIIRYARNTYIDLIAEITRFQPVILLLNDNQSRQKVQSQLKTADYPVWFVDVAFDDTWLRDTGPVSVLDEDDKVQWVDFRFNGWGNRYPAELDEKLTATLHAQGLFSDLTRISCAQVLEGGSIETDGAGTLLTTSRCLRARQVDFKRQEFEGLFAHYLGSDNVLWLDHGELLGDDTDSHIDLLARFAPDNRILYQGCQHPADPHWPFFQAMRDQLAGFRNSGNQPYTLVELPMPVIEDDHSEPVPASYANFLIINDAVLVPSYGCDHDEVALKIIGGCFPDRRAVAVDSRILIMQGGALHCAAMQLPRQVLYG